MRGIFSPKDKPADAMGERAWEICFENFFGGKFGGMKKKH